MGGISVPAGTAGLLAPCANDDQLVAELDEYVYDALHAGASGFLLKDVPVHQLAAGIRTVGEGYALLAPSITRRLIEESPGHEPQSTPHPGSTSSPPERRRVQG